MPPHLLQSVTNIPILLEAVAKALKMMKEAEVNSKVYVEYLINKLNKVIQPKPTLIMIIYNRDLNKTGSERRVRSPSAIFSRPFDFSRCAERDEKWSCGRLRQRGKRRHPYHPR